MKLSAPTDALLGFDEQLPESTVLDFWQWTYSYLSNDPTKGEFAEWMVGKLLGLEMKPGGRVEGRDYDLITLEGVKIEVKASAYWQAWKLRHPDGAWKTNLDRGSAAFPERTKIRFNGLFTGKSIPDGDGWKPAFKSDLYVFCFQHEKNPDLWDAVDLSQWDFYILTADTLRSIKAKRDAAFKEAQSWKSFSVSLAIVEKHSIKMDAKQFRREARQKITMISTARRQKSPTAVTL